MKIRKKILGLILLTIISGGVVECSSTNNNSNSQNQEVATDEDFISSFEKAINKRWDEQNKLEKKYETNTSYTEEEYAQEIGRAHVWTPVTT